MTLLPPKDAKPKGPANKIGNPNWVKGMSANPSGRPRGSRSKLTEEFFRGLSEDFSAHGIKAIEACRKADPVAYVRAIVALCPKDIVVTNKWDDMSDEQLQSAYDAAKAILAASRGDRSEGTDADPRTHHSGSKTAQSA